MKRRLLYLIPLVIIGILLGIVFSKDTITKTQLSYLDIKLASYQDVQADDNLVEGTDNVKFDAYFLVDKDQDGIADPIRGNALKIGKTSKLNIDLNVTGSSVLKNAKLIFNNKNVKTAYNSSSINELSLENIDGGTNKSYKIILTELLSNDITSYTGVNKVILKGTLVEDGIEKQITKEVEYIVDWYRDSLSAYIDTNYTTNITTNNDQIYVYYDFQTIAYSTRLLKSVNLSVDVPTLNSIKPSNVIVNGTNLTYNYNSNENKLTVSRVAELDDTKITNNVYDYVMDDSAYNHFEVVLVYPVEAGLQDASIPLNVNAYYEVYNNPDSDFTNVIRSNTSKRVMVATNKSDDVVTSVNENGPIPYLMGVSTNISSAGAIDKSPVLNLYDNLEADNITQYSYDLTTDLYYTLGKINKVLVWDADYDKFNGEQSLQNIAKYKSISFSNLSSLGQAGYIKLIDGDTNESIAVLTKDNWNDTYTFETDVRKLLIETSGIENIAPKLCRVRSECEASYSRVFNAHIVKEIDNELIIGSITRETFNTYSFIKTTIKVNLEGDHNGLHNLDSDEVSVLNKKYETPRSTDITVELNRDSIPTDEEQNIIINISTNNIDNVHMGYKNGEFLVDIPSDIININVNSVTINNSNVNISGYEVIKKDNHNLIKIFTSNNDEARYQIAINADVTPDPRVSGKSISIDVYALNKYYDKADTTSLDTYDLNNNGSTTDEVNFGSKSLLLEAASDVRTVTLVKVKDNNNNERTIITPNTTEMSVIDDKNKALVDISLINNSDEKIQDIKFIGKVGYIGNTYQLNNTDLGSEFNISMTSTGISVPSSVASNTTVYYSTVENPTDDINDVNNNWKTSSNVADYSTIKSYMIIVNDYQLPKKSSLSFTYEIDVPTSASLLNKVTYITHGVYYNRVSDGGVVSAAPIEQRKTGIMLVRKFDLTLTNYKAYSSRTISDSLYSLTSSDGSSSILKTNTNGQVIVEGLYEGRNYRLVQTSVKYPYILDEEGKTFTVIVNSQDNLVLDGNETGTYKNIDITGSDLTIDLSNETRYDFTLKNTDLDTNALIPLSKFKITGKGYEEGKILLTNASGELSLPGLYLDEEYIVTQMSSLLYLELSNQIRFIISRDANNEIAIINSCDISLLGEPHTLNSTEGFYQSYNYYYSNSQTEANAVDEGYIEVDLTDYNSTYKISYYATVDYASRNVSGYKHKIAVLTDINHIPTLSENDTYYTYTTSDITTAYSYNENNNSFEQVPIVAGNKYYIYLYSKRPNITTSGYVNFYVRLINTDGSSREDLFVNGKVNVPHSTNDNVLQTIIDNDNIDAPKFNMEVKSVPIPTYTLELTKLSADTHEPLKNAQYRIIGDGLSSSGKYIKTDENGKATITLIKDYSVYGANANVITINNYNYEKITGLYSIQEVVPPTGYQIDNNAVDFVLSKSIASNACYVNDGRASCSVYANDFLHSLEYNDVSNTPTEYQYVLDYKNNQFVEYEFDESINTLKVTMYDYPLIDITKKDAETGELLPNTLFAVYSVSYDTYGNEILEPAKDAKDNIIGSLLNINNQDYYVIATNENGKLLLPLSSGNYKAIEVQPSSDKYRVNEQGYYFMVGVTTEVENADLSYNADLNVEFGSTHYNSYTFTRSSNKRSDIIATSDGGWLLGYYDDNNQKAGVQKVNINNEVEWTWISYSNVTYTQTELYKYFDSDNVRYGNVSVSPVDPKPTFITVGEIDNEYYVGFSYSNYEVILKFDNTGRILWNNLNQINQTYYTAACYKDTGKFVDLPDYVNDHLAGKKREYDANNAFMQRDDDTYYCYTGHVMDYETGEVLIKDQTGINSNASYSQANYYSFGGDSIYQYSKDYYWRNRFILLNDGTYIPSIYPDWMSDESCYRYINGSFDRDPSWCATDIYGNLQGLTTHEDITRYGMNSSLSFSRFLLRYDTSGNLIAANPTQVYTIKALNEFFNTNYITDDFAAINPAYRAAVNKVFDNGDILISERFSDHDGYKGYDDAVLRLRYNPTTKKYDTVYSFFINVKDNLAEDYLGVQVYGDEMMYLSKPDSTYKKNLFVKNNDTIDFKEFDPTTIYVFDGTGKIKHEIDISLNEEPEVKYLMGRIYEGNNITYARIDEDRYIIAYTAYISSLNDAYTAAVQLEDSSIVNVDINDQRKLIIYEVDSQGNKKWLKQYRLSSSLYEGYDLADMAVSYDNRRLMISVPAHLDSVVTDIETGKNYSSSGSFLIFDLKNPNMPEIPEAYSIDILNDRKMLNINITSGEHGTTEVLNGDTSVYVLVNDNQSIENIKYGDDSIYTIQPKGDPGYVIDEVLLDGEDYPYTVLDDGSVVLDKFTNVTEDKNLTITFKEADAMVIVHHYLKDTTNRIASDEIISGLTNAPYETEPTYNPLYILVKDSDGEYIIPSNATGFFTVEPIVVIYFYEENLVNLKVNYYIKNTTIELSPSELTQKKLGSTYKTTKKDIIGYDVVNIIGNEEGTLDKETTEVTYMYQSVDQTTIRIRYVDKDTGASISDTITKIVNRNSEYETSAINIDGYEYFDRTANYKGIADQAEIEVTYYYVKPEVKGSPKTGDNITNIIKLLSISIIGIFISIRCIKRSKKA